MNAIDSIGFSAAVLTTSSFVPQAWHTFRSRDVSGISLGMYAVFVAGSVMWLTYGFMLEAAPVIIANAITLGLAIVILYMKLRYGTFARSRALANLAR